MQYVASTGTQSTSNVCLDFSSATNEQCVDISGMRVACTFGLGRQQTEGNASLRVKTSVCTRVIKDKETDGKLR